MRELLNALAAVGITTYYDLVDEIVQQQVADNTYNYDAALAKAVSLINADPQKYAPENY
jgi:hypothetical protein